jgi:hypothetical protein
MTKTINLSGAEVAVTGLDGAHAHINNMGADIIYASKTAGITAGADGVVPIPAGNGNTLRSISGTVYLMGTGSVLIQSDDYVQHPSFRNSTASGGSAVDEVARAAARTHAENAEIHVTADEKTAWDAKADLSDIPDSLPANGGNSNTVGGYSAAVIYKRFDGTISDANLATDLGTYTVDPGCLNVPEDEWGILSVESGNVDVWLKQTFTRLFPPHTQYVRMWNYAAWTDWEKVISQSEFDALEARVAALEGGTT